MFHIRMPGIKCWLHSQLQLSTHLHRWKQKAMFNQLGFCHRVRDLHWVSSSQLRLAESLAASGISVVNQQMEDFFNSISTSLWLWHEIKKQNLMFYIDLAAVLGKSLYYKVFLVCLSIYYLNLKHKLLRNLTRKYKFNLNFPCLILSEQLKSFSGQYFLHSLLTLIWEYYGPDLMLIVNLCFSKKKMELFLKSTLTKIQIIA